MGITPEQLKTIIKEAVEMVLQDSKDTKLTLSIDEASKLSGIGRDKITELAYIKALPCFKVGDRTRINRDKFIEWLNRISEENLNI